MRFTKNQVQELTHKAYSKGKRNSIAFALVLGIVMGICATTVYHRNQNEIQNFWDKEIKTLIQ